MNDESMNNYLYVQYARNEYSQFGEDGIIEHILETIPDTDKWCVEFGAWDGIHLSNTYNLISNKGYRSVLIEADKKKFRELEVNLSTYESILVNEFVTFDGQNKLDNILARTPIPSRFDFLSIDIDGNDYWILNSLEKFHPKVICIEFNPTIPNDVEYVQSQDFSVKRGASALSIFKLAQEKDYELVATTRCNLIFVDKKYFPLFNLQDNQLSTLRDDSQDKIYIFIGYDGSLLYSRPVYFPWHDVTPGLEKLQFLPRVLRTFPSDYNYFQKSLFIIFLFILEPKRTLSRIVNKLKKRFGSNSG